MSRLQNNDFRNYAKEAGDLVAGLSNSQCYAMYEAVLREQQRNQSDVRRKELAAVQAAIEVRKDLDQDRIAARKRGYKSSMAADARAKDGNARPNKKKV